MSDRLKTALGAGVVFLAILFWGGVLLFGILVALAAALSVSEYLRIAHADVPTLENLLVSSWGAVVVLGFLSNSAAVPGALLAVGALCYLGSWIALRGPAPDTLPRWGGAMGAWVYVAFFLGHALWIRGFGVAPVVFILAVVWAGDTAAYYVGSTFGSRRLAPRVSPKKSVEGAVASLAAGAAAALVAGWLLPLSQGLGVSLVLGVVLNGAAQVGDLAESLLKRCANQKDSGSLLPGHGGVLDRLDAFLPTLPLYALFLTLSGVWN